ncbi:MAG: hypothetical protein GY722_29190 [bacterium]|nr:hypothetical protein [bacterium]
MKKALLLLAALALTLAACGGGEEATADLPINDGEEPGTNTATCLEGEPDCNDTPGGEPQDLPSGDPDGPAIPVLTIADAAEASGQATVTGFLVDVAGESRLCEALAESFPPQCGGASITMTSLDQIDPDELKTEGDVTWTDYQVTVFGEMVDGTLVVTPVE